MTKTITAEEKTHATLGASSSHRWMNCPGSVRLTEHLPSPETSIHAAAGTAAHALAETCLRRGTEPHVYLGVAFEGILVDEEMADAVKMYTDFCRALSGETFIEKRFNLAALKPSRPLYGTADFVAFSGGVLDVVDFKFGKGVVVEADDNSQLAYYCLGAALTFPTGTEFKRIRVTIVQPRAAHEQGPIRTAEFSFGELLAFASDLLAAAQATMAPDAPLHAGSWCRWCLASGQCPEQKARAQLIAQTEFSALPANTLPAPALLSPEQFSDILGKLHVLEDWASAVRATAQAKLERGEDVPGWKLVAKRATRKWGDHETVAEWLKAKGFTAEEMYDLKLKSPAQVEKLLGRDKKALPSEFITAESSGYNVVPMSDPREEVRLTQGSEFPLLPSGN